MKHQKKRISKIIDELLSYFFHIGSKKMTIDIEEKVDAYYVTFECSIAEVAESDLKKLQKCLNCGKLEEMEEYYWELAGESDLDTELTIVGMMIDHYNLAIKDHLLTLKVVRNKEK